MPRQTRSQYEAAAHALIERWEQSARLHLRLAPEAGQSAEVGAQVGRAEAYAQCAQELRALLKAQKAIKL